MSARIVTNPGVLQGKPIIEGTRISVAFVLDLLGDGLSIDDVLREYPNLTRDGVIAAIDYARQVVDAEDVMPNVEAV